MPNGSLVSLREDERQLSLRGPLALLLQATTFAQRLGRPKRAFGVERRLLTAAGLTPHQLRWLADCRYVELVENTARRANGKRAQKRIMDSELNGGTCAILTSKGEKAARRMFVARPNQPTHPVHFIDKSSQSLAPCWSADQRQLLLGDLVVKTFQQPAANQELILAAFEEQSWPSSIDDPLPPRPGLSAKRRLHDAIKNLNRCQENCLLRFRGDGSGRRARWEIR